MTNKVETFRKVYEIGEIKITDLINEQRRLLDANRDLTEALTLRYRANADLLIALDAGKDIISAETNYKTAKAEYDFQTNISLKKEIQEAKAAAETARVDLRHIRDEMRSLGVKLAPHNANNHQRDTSLVSIYAPAAGMVRNSIFCAVSVLSKKNGGHHQHRRRNG